jgi:hypothetical protein
MSELKTYTWSSDGMLTDEQLHENGEWQSPIRKVSDNKNNWVKLKDVENTRPSHKEMDWISVDERLPKHMEHVVLRNVNKWFSFIDDNVTHTGCLVEMLGKRHWSVNGVKGAQLMSEFTHWMPLPERPKGE